MIVSNESWPEPEKNTPREALERTIRRQRARLVLLEATLETVTEAEREALGLL